MINNGPAVMDSGNNRLLIFDAFSSTDWTIASGDTTLANPPPVAIAVLGQGTSLTNFTSTTANAGNPQASFTSNGAKIATFNNPATAAVTPKGDLFVVDTYNHRVLVYPNAGQSPPPLPKSSDRATSRITVPTAFMAANSILDLPFQFV